MQITNSILAFENFDYSSNSVSKKNNNKSGSSSLFLSNFI